MKGLWKAALLALTLTTGCSDWLTGKALPVQSWQKTGELVVLVPNGPTTLFVDASGAYAGLEYDLVNRFAVQHGLKVRFVLTSSQAEALERLKLGEGHLAAGVWRSNDSGYVFGPSYQTAEPVLVHAPALRGDVLAQWANGQITLTTLPEHATILARMKSRHPAGQHGIAESSDGEDLFERVARGAIPAALVDAHTADVMQNYYPQVGILREVSEPEALAWASWAEDEKLPKMVADFFDQAIRQGDIARLVDRYYGHINRIPQMEAMTFLERRLEILPDYRRWFEEAEVKTGLDWRLLAALAYQESHWDRDVVSFTGVRGIMMLTTDTARGLGVTNREDPYQSIMGGARLLRKLIDMVPEKIPEPDKTWFALAAYNVGMAHLEDARILAGRLGKNPDRWVDVKTTLPLLRNPAYFRTVKYGYARGGEPVMFVDSLRNYYDILARYEKPKQPRQPLLTGDVVISNPIEATLLPTRLRVKQPEMAAL